MKIVNASETRTGRHFELDCGCAYDWGLDVPVKTAAREMLLLETEKHREPVELSELVVKELEDVV